MLQMYSYGSLSTYRVSSRSGSTSSPSPAPQTSAVHCPASAESAAWSSPWLRCAVMDNGVSCGRGGESHVVVDSLGHDVWRCGGGGCVGMVTRRTTVGHLPHAEVELSLRFSRICLLGGRRAVVSIVCQTARCYGVCVIGAAKSSHSVSAPRQMGRTKIMSKVHRRGRRDTYLVQSRHVLGPGVSRPVYERTRCSDNRQPEPSASRRFP